MQDLPDREREEWEEETTRRGWAFVIGLETRGEGNKGIREIWGRLIHRDGFEGEEPNPVYLLFYIMGSGEGKRKSWKSGGS